MNCFQIIKSVLDEAYAEIPGNAAQKDAAIQRQFNLLTEKYSRLLEEETMIDYSDPVTRFAYIYKYVTSHANLVCTLIEKNDTLGNLFVDNQRINVACIGGGPGSDFLGILKYLMKNRKLPVVKFHIYDRERAWEDSWFDVESKVDPGFIISTSYLPLDVTVPAQWENNKKYFQSDIFTMIYFMSEVYEKRDEAEEYFNQLFTKAKPGSLFLVIDNNNSSFYDWFDALANAHNIKILKSDETMMKMPYDEQKSDLGIYIEKFDKFAYPKLQTWVAYRIGRKE